MANNLDSAEKGPLGGLYDAPLYSNVFAVFCFGYVRFGIILLPLAAFFLHTNRSLYCQYSSHRRRVNGSLIGKNQILC